MTSILQVLELSINRRQWAANNQLCFSWIKVNFKLKIHIVYCMYSRGELFMRSREGYVGVYFPSCTATREINTKITLGWAHKQFVTRVHILSYFLHDITILEMSLKTRIFTHHPRDSFARFTVCWWRHNRLAMTSQWPNNCDANTWQLISNSLDIDFIHGDIHDRSCKK